MEKSNMLQNLKETCYQHGFHSVKPCSNSQC